MSMLLWIIPTALAAVGAVGILLVCLWEDVGGDGPTSIVFFTFISIVILSFAFIIYMAALKMFGVF